MSSLAVRLAAKLSGKGNIVPIHIFYVKALEGDYIAAALFTQLLYWHDKMDGKEFYKSDEDLSNELCLSPYQLGRARGVLKDFGITTKRKGIPAKMHYKIDDEVLNNKLLSLLVTVDQETKEQVTKKLSNSKSSLLVTVDQETKEQVPIETKELIQETTAIDYTEDYTEELDRERISQTHSKKIGKKDEAYAIKFFQSFLGFEATEWLTRKKQGLDLLQIINLWGEQAIKDLYRETLAMPKAHAAQKPIYRFMDALKGNLDTKTKPLQAESLKTLEFDPDDPYAFENGASLNGKKIWN